MYTPLVLHSEELVAPIAKLKEYRSQLVDSRFCGLETDSMEDLVLNVLNYASFIATVNSHLFESEFTVIDYAQPYPIFQNLVDCLHNAYIANDCYAVCDLGQYGDVALGTTCYISEYTEYSDTVEIRIASAIIDVDTNYLLTKMNNSNELLFNWRTGQYDLPGQWSRSVSSTGHARAGK